MKNSYKIFFFLVIFYIFSRLLFLFTSLPAFYDDEEFYIGTSAFEILKGPQLPLFEYMYFPNEGGSLFMALLAVPFFKIFGPYFISLKLTGLFLSFITFIIWYFFINIYFNQKIANIFGFFYIIGPLVFTKSEFMSWGHHNNINFFIILSIFSFYGAIYSKDSKIKSIYFMIFGILCGFAMYFAYIFVITFISLLLIWFITDNKLFLKKNFLIFLFFFFLGFIPWIYFNLSHNFEGLQISGHNLYNISSHPFFKFINLIFVVLPHSLIIEFTNNSLFKILPAYLFYIFIIISYLFIFWKIRKLIFNIFINSKYIKENSLININNSKLIFFVLYPIIFCLIYCFSSSEIEISKNQDFISFRYLYNLFPIIYFLIAQSFIFLNEFKLRYLNYFKIILIIIFLLPCVIGSVILVSKYSSKDNFKYKGYSYEIFCERIGNKYRDNINKSIEYIEKTDFRFRNNCYTGLGYSFSQFSDNDIPKIINIINKLDDKYKKYLYEGLGWKLAFKSKLNMDILSSWINNIDDKYKTYCYYGVGLLMGKLFIDNFDIALNLINKIEVKYQIYLYEGFGFYLGSKFYLEYYKYFKILNLIYDPYKSIFNSSFNKGRNLVLETNK